MAKKVYQLDANDAVSQPTDRAALFVSGTAYAVGDFVCYENRIYVCKQATDGTKLPTDTAYWNDMTYVSSQFTSANTSLTGLLPYGSVIHDSVSVTLTDGAINALPAFASGDTPVLTVPLPADGKTTDLIIRADCTTVCPTDLGITASGVTWRDISGDTMAVGKVYWVAIVVTPTDTAGEYDGVMSIKELKERTVTA